MFPSRIFADRFFPIRFFPPIGADVINLNQPPNVRLILKIDLSNVSLIIKTPASLVIKTSVNNVDLLIKAINASLIIKV